MASLHDRSAAEFEVFSTVPRWFFEESVHGPFTHHDITCDVGFRQESALVFDLEATLRALDAFVPFDEELVERCASTLRSTGCRAALCDISPFGIAVAERAGVPSLLVENFSWSWLYEPFFEEVPSLRRLSVELEEWSGQATLHVQAEPVCSRDLSLEIVGPISRVPRLDRAAARASLDLELDEAVVVLTMGGHGEEFGFIDRLSALTDIKFLVTGAHETQRTGNIRLFDSHTPLFMPNLLRAADAVVAKLGYGILAEAWREGLPIAYVTREDSREMPSLEAFAAREVAGFVVRPEQFASGAWTDRLGDLLSTPRRRPTDRGGTNRVAEILEGLG